VPKFIVCAVVAVIPAVNVFVDENVDAVLFNVTVVCKAELGILVAVIEAPDITGGTVNVFIPNASALLKISPARFTDWGVD
jgi:hypothetical protein